MASSSFTSDGSNDILQVQATATASDILYNSGGIGLASLTGVTKLQFDGNGGNDLLILQSPPGTHFAPVNGIVFNGGGQAGDELDMIGGANTWTGTYAPTTSTDGALTITNSPGTLTQTIGFTGISTIRNSLSGTTMAITTPASSDTINVETGPNLGNIGAVQQGPVLIDGGDRDDHGSFGSGGSVIGFYKASAPVTDYSQNLEPGGWNTVSNATVTNPTTVPHLSVSGAGDNTIDFYRFTTTADGATVTLDVDGTTGGFNSLIAIYDDQGNVIAQNDNSALDAGSTTTNDSFLTVTLAHADTYYVGVGRSGDVPTTGGFTTAALGVPSAATYTLNVSVDFHGTTAVVDAPLAETEPNQGTFTLPAANLLGWQFIQQGVDFVRSNAFNAAPANSVLAVGLTGYSATGTQAGKALWNVAQVLGLNVTVVTGAAISSANLNNFRMIYVPTGDPQTIGGISQADKDLFAARTTAIRDYINSGGGVFALTEDSLTNPFNWLQIPNPFTISTGPLPNGPGGAGTDALTKTAAAIAAGLTISNTDLTLGTPYHNVFTGPPGYNNLLPFVLNSVNSVVALGLGAIQNPGLGGAGPSTAITFGTNPVTAPTFPKMYVTATTGVSLNGDGGSDTYNVQLATPVLTTIAITDLSGTAGDAAFLFGTTTAETYSINAGGNSTVFYTGAVSQTLPFSGLEAMTVDGKTEPAPTTGDTFTLRPVSTTAFTITAGGPTLYPGDTLQLDLTGGLNALNPTFNPVGDALPDGNLTMTGGGFPAGPAVTLVGSAGGPEVTGEGMAVPDGLRERLLAEAMG